MFTVVNAKQQPGGMVLPAIRGRLVEISPIEDRTSNDGTPTTVQSFKIADENGKDWMLGSAWGREDLLPWQDQVVVFASTKSGNGRFLGVTLKEKPNPKNPQFPYKNIQVGGSAALHTPESYAAAFPQQGDAHSPRAQQRPANQPAPGARPQTTPQAQSAQRPPAASSQINGQTVGMAVKAAVDIWIAVGMPDDVAKPMNNFIHEHAGMIIRVSQRLERGELAPLAHDNPAALPEPEHPPQNLTRPTPPRPSPKPGPEGSAYDPNDGGIDEDVPFN